MKKFNPSFKPLTDAMTAKEFMRRPEIDYATATQFVGPAAEDLDAKYYMSA